MDEIYQEGQVTAKLALENEFVTLSLDGWSNINNEPVVCVAATTSKGDTYLLSTEDTTSNKHTADHLRTLVISTIEQAENGQSRRHI